MSLAGVRSGAASFVLHEELLAFQEHSQLIFAELSVPDTGAPDVDARIDELAELLQSDPTLVLTGDHFDLCRSLIKYFDELTLGQMHAFSNLVLSAFEEAVRATKMDLDESANHNFETDRVLTEMYAFLCFCLVERAEAKWKVVGMMEGAAGAAKGSKSKSKSKAINAGSGAGSWDWPAQRERVAAVLEQLAAIAIERIVLAASERDVLVNIICRSVGLMLEDPKTVKKESIRTTLIDTLCLVATRHENQSQSSSTGGLRARVQDYLREDHLADFVAELLNAMVANHDNTPFFESVVNDIAERHFSERDIKPAKTVARCIVRLSEIRPRELMRCMAQLQAQLDSESYTIRCAMIESIGNIIHIHLVNDASEAAAKTLHRFYDIFVERFRDVNHYVRTKVLQVLARLSERRPDAPAVTDIPLDTRHRLVTLTIHRLRDKASIVRKNAIKLLARFVETSPFIAIEEDQGRLSLTYFETRRSNLVEIIRAKYPAETMEDISVVIEGRDVDAQERDGSVAGTPRKNNRRRPHAHEDDDSDEDMADAQNDDDDEQTEEESPSKQTVDHALANDVELQRLRALLKYYNDGIQFIRQISTGAVPVLADLLSSNIKTEVVEAMRFFVVAFRYEVEAAWEGVRRMVHKVWDKDTTGTGAAASTAAGGADADVGSIREHVMRCYESLFLDPPEGPRPVAEVIAENLIGLTQRMSLAELTSLEQLLALMAQSDRLNMEAVELLWDVFSGRALVVGPQVGVTNASAPSATDLAAGATQRREGALMVLGMIGKSRKDVLVQNLDRLVRDGLGRPGTPIISNIADIPNMPSSRQSLIPSTVLRMPTLSLARLACIALQHIAASDHRRGKAVMSNPSNGSGRDPSLPRLPVRHPLFVRLVELVCTAQPSNVVLMKDQQKSWLGIQDPWFPFCEQAINAVYALAEHPDKIVAVMIRRLARDVFADTLGGPRGDDGAAGENGSANRPSRVSGGAELFGSTSTEDGEMEVDDAPKVSSTPRRGQQSQDNGIPRAIRMAQLFFVVGHVAIRQIVHLEAIEAEWKRRRATEEAGGRSGKNGSASGGASGGDLDQVTGSAEDEFMDRVAAVRERELLFGPRSLLSVFGPMIAHVCMMSTTKNQSQQRSFAHHPVLQTMASLSLVKLMCVSARFCDAHLPLLFSVLEHVDDDMDVIRSNAVIGMGDMAIAFNALIDPHIGRLYARVSSDPSRTVRKDALMVLTFLVLNGMVKVKGQLAHMARCLEDRGNGGQGDTRIRDLARMFFTELATRDQAIYNNLPDMISSLSVTNVDGRMGHANGSETMDETRYRSIMRFLFDFVKREKQGEAMVDKLLARMKSVGVETKSEAAADYDASGDVVPMSVEPTEQSSDGRSQFVPTASSLTLLYRQWSDLAYCLSLLPFGTDKSLRKLVDAMPSVLSDKMHVDGVYRAMLDIVKRVKKTGSSLTASSAGNGGAHGFVPGVGNGTSVKPGGSEGLRGLADTLEKMVEEARVKCLASKDAVQRAERDKKTNMGVAASVSIMKRGGASTSGRGRLDDDRDVDEDDRDSLVDGENDKDSHDGIVERDDDVATTKTTKTRSGAKSNAVSAAKRRGANTRAKTNRRRKVIEEDDDEDENESESSGSDLDIVDEVAAAAMRGQSTPIGRDNRLSTGGRTPGSAKPAVAAGGDGRRGKGGQVAASPRLRLTRNAGKSAASAAATGGGRSRRQAAAAGGATTRRMVVSDDDEW